MLSGNLDNDFLTHITIYCPLTDTRPLRYKESTSYDIRLLEEDFSSLQGFKNVIKERTRAGFLKSQFFRVTFDRNITDESHTFISDDDEILQAFDSNRELPWQLIIVRYTKVQASRLRDKLKSGEQTELDILTRQKRRYNKSSPFPRESKQDMNVSTASIATGDIYEHSNYASDTIPSTQRLDCNIDMGMPPPSFLHTDPHILEYSPGFNSLIRHSDSASTQTISTINRSSENECIHSHSHDIMAWHTEVSPGSILTLNEAVARIRTETPMGRLFSSRALEIWASELILDRHNSYFVPPSFFPIPDIYIKHAWRNIAVPIELQPIAMLYSKYIADKALENATFSEEDDTDELSISICSNKHDESSNLDVDDCTHDDRIDNLSDDDGQINLL